MKFIFFIWFIIIIYLYQNLYKNNDIYNDIVFNDVDNLDRDEILQFYRDGFLIKRNIIDKNFVKSLYNDRPRSMFPLLLRPFDWVFQYISTSVISIDMIWTESRLCYNFWFKGPIPKMVYELMGRRPVRLLTDIVFGVLYGKKPMLLGKWHKDGTSFDIIEPYTSNGISVWIPLTDIDAFTQGGSIHLGNWSLVKPECKSLKTYELTGYCKKHLDEISYITSFRRGDVLFFTDNTFHRTQTIKNMISDRFAFVGRFVQGNSIYIPSTSIEKQRKNFCNHNLTKGDFLHSNCFPQVYPRVYTDFSSIRVPSSTKHFIYLFLDYFS